MRTDGRPHAPPPTQPIVYLNLPTYQPTNLPNYPPNTTAVVTLARAPTAYSSVTAKSFNKSTSLAFASAHSCSCLPAALPS